MMRTIRVRIGAALLVASLTLAGVAISASTAGAAATRNFYFPSDTTSCGYDYIQPYTVGYDNNQVTGQHECYFPEPSFVIPNYGYSTTVFRLNEVWFYNSTTNHWDLKATPWTSSFLKVDCGESGCMNYDHSLYWAGGQIAGAYPSVEVPYGQWVATATILGFQTGTSTGTTTWQWYRVVREYDGLGNYVWGGTPQLVSPYLNLSTPW